MFSNNFTLQNIFKFSELVNYNNNNNNNKIRHRAINDVISRAFASAQVPATKEPKIWQWTGGRGKAVLPNVLQARGWTKV